MNPPRPGPAGVSRRDFLKRTGVGAAGLTLGSASARAAKEPPGALPPHRALAVPGVHLYGTDHSVAAGSAMEFHVSASVPYRLSICRLGSDPDSPDRDEVLHEFAPAPPNPQPIHPGSYVHIEKALANPLPALTLECWVRAFAISGHAGLITQYDFKSRCGLGIFLMPGGAVGFYTGDGAAYRAACSLATAKGALQAGRWHHVAATWDGGRKRVWIDGKLRAEAEHAEALQPGPAPLRLGAYGETGVASRFLEGDLAMPAIHDRALGAEEIAAHVAQRALTIPEGPHVLGCWPFSEERGAGVADASPQGRHGRIINHATWMIGGPSFQAEVARYGRYEPGEDPARGHGLRFASDDLYDCRWSVTHRWPVPQDARPGVYVARAEFEFEERKRTTHGTFIVRRAPKRRKARLLVLAAANTWRAYGGTPFVVAPPQTLQLWGTGGHKSADARLPAFNLYRTHQAGQGSYQVGLRMPWPAAGPYVLYGEATRYSHLLRAERFTHIWLEAQGYAYDLISDVDLHREPDALRGYAAVMILGHNEYWSLPMFQGLESYLKSGGNVVCLSGNSICWRVSFDDDCAVMECRKVDAPGMQVPAARRGEAWHSHDGRRGGLMRECGWPGWKLIGLDTLGWNNQGKADNFGPYTVEDPDHFLFRQPEELGLKKGDRFGQGPDGSLPMANGHEFDIRPSTLARLQEEPPPAGATVPPDPPNIRLLANGILPWKKGGSAFDYFFRKITPKTDQGGEVIYWERPDGGRVFNAGTIGSGWTLAADPKFAGLLRNVLAHFGVAPNRAR